jgi:hypothetical protein
MKKYSLAFLAAAALNVQVRADEASAPVGEKPIVCPTVEAVCTNCTDAKCASVDAHNEVIMTMTAIPGGEQDHAGHENPELMYMTGVVEDHPGPTRHQEGENFRDLSNQQLMVTTGMGSSARFEGLRQVASERHAFGADRSGIGGSDKRTLKGMLFGSKTDTKAKTTLVANQRAQMQKMAEIDRLRDQALKTGDVKLLSQADAMEKEAKAGAKSSNRFSLFGRK